MTASQAGCGRAARLFAPARGGSSRKRRRRAAPACYLTDVVNAEGGTRTHTPVRTPDFESDASAIPPLRPASSLTPPPRASRPRAGCGRSRQIGLAHQPAVALACGAAALVDRPHDQALPPAHV